jgi:oxygen-dependent protoporphyrinogen oxidase
VGWRLRTHWRPGRIRRGSPCIEGSPRLGGKLAGDELEGVPVDLGAESVLARRPEAVDLIRAVGLGDDVVHPATTSAGLWVGDRIRAIPPTVMGVPVDRAATADVLGSEAAEQVAHEADLPAPALTEGRGRSAGSLPSGWAPAVTDKLIDPLLGGVYAGIGRGDLARRPPSRISTPNSDRAESSSPRRLTA